MAATATSSGNTQGPMRSDRLVLAGPAGFASAATGEGARFHTKRCMNRRTPSSRARMTNTSVQRDTSTSEYWVMTDL